MFRIVLHDFSVPNSFQDIVQADLVFGHFLLCVLRDPYVSDSRQGLDAE
jgi:hypothetical protein